MKIGFIANDLIDFRGGNVVLFDYGIYNQSLLGNESVMLVCRSKANPLVVQKFKAKLDVVFYEEWSELEQICKDNKIDATYIIKDGCPSDLLVPGVKNLIHAAFYCHVHEGPFHVHPHGDRYAVVSNWLSVTCNNEPFVPHMVDLPDVNGDYRKQLGIPKNAMTFGNFGGADSFDMEIAKNAILKALDKRSDLYFIFMNTREWTGHERCLFMDGTSDVAEKVKFVQTSDAYIEARSRGQTFGLSPLEFNSKNKPVYMWWGVPERCVIDDYLHLRGGVYYNDEQHLVQLLLSADRNEIRQKDWVCTQDLTPEKVMQKFKVVFLG